MEHNYFSIGCIIGEIGNDLESDPQNSLQEDFKVIVSEGNIKEGQTSDPRKTSADRRMIAIVDDEESDPKFEERKASQIPQNTRINTLWAVLVWPEWAEGRTQRLDPNHWRQ